MSFSLHRVILCVLYVSLCVLCVVSASSTRRELESSASMVFTHVLRNTHGRARRIRVGDLA